MKGLGPVNVVRIAQKRDRWNPLAFDPALARTAGRQRVCRGDPDLPTIGNLGSTTGPNALSLSTPAVGSRKNAWLVKSTCAVIADPRCCSSPRNNMGYGVAETILAGVRSRGSPALPALESPRCDDEEFKWATPADDTAEQRAAL